MNKSLKEFRLSLGAGSKDTLIEEGRRLVSQFEDYGISPPYCSVSVPGVLKRLSARIDSDGRLEFREYLSTTYRDATNSDTKVIDKMVLSYRSRLAKLDSQFDKVASMYSTDVARIVFSGTTGKTRIVQCLKGEKQHELMRLVPDGIMRKVIDKPNDRLYLSTNICGFTVILDYRHGGRRLDCLTTNLLSDLKFLSEFPRIKGLFRDKLELIFGKEAINESARS